MLLIRWTISIPLRECIKWFKPINNVVYIDGYKFHVISECQLSVVIVRMCPEMCHQRAFNRFYSLSE